MNRDEDPPPADPAESLRLIQEGQQRAERDLCLDPRLLYWPWGVAWAIGFGAFYLRHGPDGQVLVAMPAWLPLALLFALLAGAAVVFGAGISRAAQRVQGESSRRGWMYGATFTLGIGGLAFTLGRVADSLPEPLAGLLWAAAMVGLVSTLLLAGGAVWLDRSMFAIGSWLLLINAAGVLAGPGWHALVVAVAGGGGLLVAGTVAWIRHRRRMRG